MLPVLQSEVTWLVFPPVTRKTLVQFLAMELFYFATDKFVVDMSEVVWLVFPPVTRKTRVQFPALELLLFRNRQVCCRHVACAAVRGNIVVSVSACHAEDPSSIPGLGVVIISQQTTRLSTCCLCCSPKHSGCFRLSRGRPFNSWPWSCFYFATDKFVVDMSEVVWLVFPPVTRKTRVQFPALELLLFRNIQVCCRHATKVLQSNIGCVVSLQPCNYLYFTAVKFCVDMLPVLQSKVIVVSVSACHAEDPSSIPGLGVVIISQQTSLLSTCCLCCSPRHSGCFRLSRGRPFNSRPWSCYYFATDKFVVDMLPVLQSEVTWLVFPPVTRKTLVQFLAMELFLFRNRQICCRHVRGSIVVSISACHAEDPGSIPGLGVVIISQQTSLLSTCYKSAAVQHRIVRCISSALLSLLHSRQILCRHVTCAAVQGHSGRFRLSRGRPFNSRPRSCFYFATDKFVVDMSEVVWLVFPPVTRKTRVQFPALELLLFRNRQVCCRHVACAA
eukprot:284818927_5